MRIIAQILKQTIGLGKFAVKTRTKKDFEYFVRLFFVCVFVYAYLFL